jgi:hypothetical protein
VGFLVCGGCAVSRGGGEEEGHRKKIKKPHKTTLLYSIYYSFRLESRISVRVRLRLLNRERWV